MEAFAPTTTAAAFYACALVSYDDVKKMLSRAGRTSTAGLLLAATAWQCEGDVLRAESTLRRALETSEADRPYVVDILAPLLISRGLFNRAAALIVAQRKPPLPLEIGWLALRSIIDAASGAVPRSEEAASVVREALSHIDDDILRLRVHQRLAMAAYYRGDAVAALEEVAHGLRTSQLLDASRAACTLHSVAYATQYSLLGDFEAAWRHVLALGREAERGGDESYRAFARVAEYELAAERGDSECAIQARIAIDAKPLPEQYRERFAVGIADALRLSWSGDLSTCRNVLTVLKDTSGRSDGERALCRALLALLGVAMADEDAARRFSRQAISTSARPTKHIVAYELRYRRLARALAAIAGEFVGDIVRGRRAADARFVREDADVAALLDLRSGADVCDVPVSVRGYARFAAVARERLSLRTPAGPLTTMEVEVVRLVAAGRKAPQIAILLNRSPHTVRTHLRNASAKLEAHGRIDLLQRARQLGILKEPHIKGLNGAST
jgi:DNA-binding CsgD family transcriptional regulator